MTTVMDTFKLDGRTAVVTGGAGLLGKEFCRTLLEGGANVVVADLNGSAAEAVASDLNAAGQAAGRAIGVAVNVTQPGSVAGLVQAAVDAFGQLDVLVNSAALDPKFEKTHAGLHTNSFEEYPLDKWNQALEVNLTGMFLCCQAAVKPMLAQGRGSIINICSTYGLVGPDQRIYQRDGQQVQYKPVYYSVTKAGVLGMTHYLSTYFAGQNIRVNALTPGGVFNNHDETFLKAYSARAVMGRMAHLHEMNGALLFLASDASSYMTGSNLVVDGGWTAW